MNKGVTLSLKELRSPLYDAKLDITLGLEMLKQSFNGCTSDICVCVCVYTYIYIYSMSHRKYNISDVFIAGGTV